MAVSARAALLVLGVAGIELAHIALVVLVDGVVHRLPGSQTVETGEGGLGLQQCQCLTVGDEVVVPCTEHIGLRTSDILLAQVGILHIAHGMGIGRMVDVIEVAHEVAPLHRTCLRCEELFAICGILAEQGTARDVLRGLHTTIHHEVVRLTHQSVGGIALVAASHEVAQSLQFLRKRRVVARCEQTDAEDFHLRALLDDADGMLGVDDEVGDDGAVAVGTHVVECLSGIVEEVAVGHIYVGEGVEPSVEDAEEGTTRGVSDGGEGPVLQVDVGGDVHPELTVHQRTVETIGSVEHRLVIVGGVIAVGGRIGVVEHEAVSLRLFLGDFLRLLAVHHLIPFPAFLQSGGGIVGIFFSPR